MTKPLPTIDTRKDFMCQADGSIRSADLIARGACSSI
jgi:hypothetical protein